MYLYPSRRVVKGTKKVTIEIRRERELKGTLRRDKGEEETEINREKDKEIRRDKEEIIEITRR